VEVGAWHTVAGHSGQAAHVYSPGRCRWVPSQLAQSGSSSHHRDRVDSASCWGGRSLKLYGSRNAAAARFGLAPAGVALSNHDWHCCRLDSVMALGPCQRAKSIEA